MAARNLDDDNDGSRLKYFYTIGRLAKITLDAFSLSLSLSFSLSHSLYLCLTLRYKRTRGNGVDDAEREVASNYGMLQFETWYIGRLCKIISVSVESISVGFSSFIFMLQS